jgi:hypothetical protein
VLKQRKIQAVFQPTWYDVSRLGCYRTHHPFVDVKNSLSRHLLLCGPPKSTLYSHCVGLFEWRLVIYGLVLGLSTTDGCACCKQAAVINSAIRRNSEVKSQMMR